jgi:hypothetical protein
MTRVRTFGEQEFNEIRPVLAGDTGDEGHLAVTVGVGSVFTHAARLVLDRRRVCFRTRGYRNGHDVRRCGLNQTNEHEVRDGRVGRSAVDRRARQRVRVDWMDVNSQWRWKFFSGFMCMGKQLGEFLVLNFSSTSNGYRTQLYS